MPKKIVPGGVDGVHVAVDNLTELKQAIARLTRDVVLVGVPEETTARNDPQSLAIGLTNAALAYIHDNGAPEAKIPQRPFMIPGMNRSKSEVVKLLTKTASYGLSGQPNKIPEGLERVGLLVRDNIRSTIDEGIPPPLAKLTLQKRAAKGRKGAQAELDRRDAGVAPSLDPRPLIDTGEMRKSITWVVRPRDWNKKES